MRFESEIIRRSFCTLQARLSTGQAYKARIFVSNPEPFNLHPKPPQPPLASYPSSTPPLLSPETETLPAFCFCLFQFCNFGSICNLLYLTFILRYHTLYLFQSFQSPVLVLAVSYVHLCSVSTRTRVRNFNLHLPVFLLFPL